PPIKGSPTTIAVLHAPDPAATAAHGVVAPAAARTGRALERQEHHRRIVHIRIEIVAEFKRPPARISVGILYLPVSGPEDLLLDQPFCPSDEGGMIGPESRLFVRRREVCGGGQGRG